MLVNYFYFFFFLLNSETFVLTSFLMGKRAAFYVVLISFRFESKEI